MAIDFKASLLLSLLACSLAQRPPDVSPSENFDNSIILDNDNYFLFWNANSTHVTFEVHVKTRGYVGFGLSPNGDMFPADVVIGWVKDNVVYFKDYHTTAHAPPEPDMSQDYILLYGEENDFGTVLKFTRKLDTCDDDGDRVISEATQRIIYAYHPNDPESETGLFYHGAERRGTKSVSLLAKHKPTENIDDENIKVFEIRARNYTVPENSTSFRCLGFQMPALPGKHHMIQYEPIITPGNEGLFHHVVIHRCPGNHPELHGVGEQCLHVWPKGWPDCPEVFVAWAIGGGAYYFPPSAGYSVGAADDNPFYVMETHYNNPSNKVGVLDSSGIRIRLTPKVRQYDVGGLMIGHAISPFQVIPPHEEKFVTKGYCAAKCMEKSLKDIGASEIRIIAALQHAHLLATGIKTRHFRDGVELPPIQDDPSYSFNFQEMRTLKEEVVVTKNDSFQVECTYNTKGRSNVTIGGMSTGNEMCETFLYHYPRLSTLVCDSHPSSSQLLEGGNMLPSLLSNESLSMDQQVLQAMGSTNWLDEEEREAFQDRLQNMTVNHRCIGIKDNKLNQFEFYAFVESESDHIPYSPPPRQCPTSSQGMPAGSSINNKYM